MTPKPPIHSCALVRESCATGDLVRVVADRTAPRGVRLAAGARLARAGDPRPGVQTLEPAWCVVPAGAFVMGAGPSDPDADEAEQPQHLVRLPTFHMARYPVTNAQWRLFVEEGGYAVERWWSRAGWRARAASGWETPRFWCHDGWSGNEANRPVVGVSWHEAVAFCRWLSFRLEYVVRLCTEAEWEKAARGRDGRRYPFGDEMDREALHARATDAPAPVGCYPRGVSPWGIEDMVGNTYAWTSSRWGRGESMPAFRYPYASGDGREDCESDDYRVVRGGAWSFPLRNVRCSYRGKDRPEDAFNNLGVRLVAAPSAGAGDGMTSERWKESAS